MFTITCPEEHAEVLLGPRRIERLDNTDDGVVIHWRCYCGATGRSQLRAGRSRADQPTAA